MEQENRYSSQSGFHYGSTNRFVYISTTEYVPAKERIWDRVSDFFQGGIVFFLQLWSLIFYGLAVIFVMGDFEALDMLYVLMLAIIGVAVTIIPLYVLVSAIDSDGIIHKFVMKRKRKKTP